MFLIYFVDLVILFISLISMYILDIRDFKMNDIIHIHLIVLAGITEQVHVSSRFEERILLIFFDNFDEK